MTPGPFADVIDDSLGRVIEHADGTYDIVLERRLKKPVDKVWAALTVPERIACWFTEAEVEPRVGGRYALRFPQHAYAVEGVITEFEAPRVIAHTWPHEDHPQSIVRYELAPDGDGCRLTLTQTGLGRKSLGALPGWHAHLEALPGAAEGVRTPWTWDREKAIGERYRELMPA